MAFHSPNPCSCIFFSLANKLLSVSIEFIRMWFEETIHGDGNAPVLTFNIKSAYLVIRLWILFSFAFEYNNRVWIDTHFTHRNLSVCLRACVYVCRVGHSIKSIQTPLCVIRVVTRVCVCALIFIDKLYARRFVHLVDDGRRTVWHDSGTFQCESYRNVFTNFGEMKRKNAHRIHIRRQCGWEMYLGARSRFGIYVIACTGCVCVRVCAQPCCLR